MARELLLPDPDNASIHELKEASRIGTGETSLRCSAIHMLIVGIACQQVYDALLVDHRSLRRWVNAFNERGIDGLTSEPRSGRPPKIKKEQVDELVELIEQPEKAERDFWTARAFHGYIQEKDQVD